MTNGTKKDGLTDARLAGLQVRPLEWSGQWPEQPGLVAYAIGATNPFGGMGWGYRIDYPNDRSTFHATSHGLSVKCKTIEEAVAACESHYQDRASAAILAALSANPERRDREAKLVEALKGIVDLKDLPADDDYKVRRMAAKARSAVALGGSNGTE